jgi:hypothetical protein
MVVTAPYQSFALALFFVPGSESVALEWQR